MPIWTKTASSGAPKSLNTEQKRNLIATNHGWTRRIAYTEVHGNARQKDEPLIAIGNLDLENTFGRPAIHQVYVANTTGGNALKRNRVNYVYVVYNEAVSIPASASPLRLTVANTAGGNTVIATSNTAKGSIVNANNTLTFKFKVATAGTYKIQAQNLTNTAQHRVYSVVSGLSNLANNNISAAVSNTNSTFTIV